MFVNSLANLVIKPIIKINGKYWSNGSDNLNQENSDIEVKIKQSGATTIDCFNMGALLYSFALHFV
jgi:hypothetical protein